MNQPMEGTKMRHVMLDLETFGTSPEAAVVSIGAVKFDNEKVGEEFHVKIDMRDSLLGTIDGNTVAWWLQQSDAARAALTKGPKELLAPALQAFTRWLGPDPRELLLWSNGPSFDSVILQSAYRRCGLTWPFKYNADRDFRTICDLRPIFRIVVAPYEIAHDALEDAKRQARCVMEIAKALEILTTRET